MTCNLHSSLEAAKEAMEKLSTETKEYFERQTELINKAFIGDEQMTKTKPEIKRLDRDIEESKKLIDENNEMEKLEE